MGTLLQTILLASIVVILALLGLAIGWLITGKSRIRGSCGRAPRQSKDDSCGTTNECELCKKPKKDE